MMETTMKIAFAEAKARKNAAHKAPQFRIDVDALADREARKAEFRAFVNGGCKAVVTKSNIEGLHMAVEMTLAEYREYVDSKAAEAKKNFAAACIGCFEPMFVTKHAVSRSKSFYELWLARRDAEAVKAEARRAAAAANNAAAAAAAFMSGKADIDASVFGKHCHFKTGTTNGAPVFVNDFEWVDDKKTMVEKLHSMGNEKVHPYASYKTAVKAFKFLRHAKEHKFQNLLEYALLNTACMDNFHYGRVHLEKHIGDCGERFIDLNSAMPEELTELNGIGEKLSMKLVEYRHDNGGFTDLEKEFDVAVGRKGAYAKALAGNVRPMINGKHPYKKMTDKVLFEVLLVENHHELPERLRKGTTQSAPEGKKSIFTQKINFGIRKNLECYGYVALDVSSVSNNPFTSSYAVDDGSISFTQVTGYERHIPAGKCATNDIVSVNTGDIIRACNGDDTRIEKADRNRVCRMVKKMRDGEWKVIRTNVPVDWNADGSVKRRSVVEHTDVVLKTNLGNYMSLVYYNKKLVKNSAGRKIHKMVRYTAAEVEAALVGVYTAKDGMIQSTAQDRTDDRTYFNMKTKDDQDKFHRAFEEATTGAAGFLVSLGSGMTSCMLVDMATRLSAHACSMGMRADQGAKVGSICIVFSKNDFGDGGDCLINVKTFADEFEKVHGVELSVKERDAFEGKQAQMRAFSEKCTALFKSPEYIVKEINGLRLAYVDVSKENFTEDELKMLQALATKLVKGAYDALKAQGKDDEVAARKALLENTDGIVLYNGEIRKEDDCPDIVASLNEVKNTWEFKICSGYNVLLMPHYAGDTKEDFKRVYTSNQMLKVFYRLAHDTKSVEELEGILTGIIGQRIVELTDYDERAAKAKANTTFAPIDSSYAAGTLMGLNSEDMYNHPELQVPAIKDAMNTLSKECTMDRWPLPGATMMFHMDPSFYPLRRNAGKQMDNGFLPAGLLKIRKDGSIEVYSALANKFFDERNTPEEERYGFVVKYPAMGTRELAVVHFISDAELAARLDAMKGLSFHDKLDIVNACNHQGYGTVFAPADLPTMGWILAGLDRDGDEGCFVFHVPGENDLPAYLVKHGYRPLAVDIGKDGIEPKNDPEHNFGFDVFGFASRAKSSFGNLKIGPVTYGFMRCLQPLMADWAVEIKKAYLRRFADAFDMKKNGTEVYHPVIDWSKDEDPESFGYAKTYGKKTSDEIIARIKAMKAFTGDDDKLQQEWHELIKICKDLDVLGRHTQELTIDAGKKFYEVAAGFVNNVAEKIGLIYQRFGVKFDIDWKTVLETESPVVLSTHASEKSLRGKTIFGFDQKTVYDAKTFIPATQDLPFYVGKADKGGSFSFDDAVLYFPDFFAKMRHFAIKESMEAVENMVEIYKLSCQDENLAEARSENYAFAYDMLEEAGVRGEIDYVVESLAMTVRHAYAERQAKYREELIHDYMSVEEESRAEEAIRKQLHSDFDDLLARVDNMLRLSKEKAIAAAKGKEGVYVGDDVFVDYLLGDDNGRGGNENGYVYAGKLLKAEMTATAISRSYVNEARELVSAKRRKDADEVTKAIRDVIELGSKLLVDSEGDVLYVDENDNEVALDARVNADRVPEGYYDAKYDEESDSVCLVKPLADFVEIPEANHDELTIPVMMNAIGDKDKLGESIEKLQVAAEEGKKIFIGLSQDRYHNVTIYTKDPSAGKGEGVEAVCEVYQGISSNGKRNGSKGIARGLYYGVMGDFVDAVQTESHDDKGNVTARFGFITLNNLERPNGSKVDEEDDESSFFDGDEPEVEFH